MYIKIFLYTLHDLCENLPWNTAILSPSMKCTRKLRDKLFRPVDVFLSEFVKRQRQKWSICGGKVIPVEFNANRLQRIRWRVNERRPFLSTSLRGGRQTYMDYVKLACNVRLMPTRRGCFIVDRVRLGALVIDHCHSNMEQHNCSMLSNRLVVNVGK